MDRMHFCWRSCPIFFIFPEFFQRFCQLFKFPEFSRFSMFSRFVATLSYIQNGKTTTKIFSQIHSAPLTQRPKRQSTHQIPVVVHVNYAKNVLKGPAVLELLVLGLLIKLDSPLIDASKNENQTFILTSFTNIFIAMNRQGPKL